MEMISNSQVEKTSFVVDRIGTGSTTVFCSSIGDCSGGSIVAKLRVSAPSAC